MILLDTHTWVWFVSNPELLSEGALEKINIGVQEKSILISSISVWEVALLVKRQRLVLTIELENWISMSENLPFFSFVPIDNDIAVKSVQLPPPLHNDPADRIIIATAIKTGATLISKDEKILGYPGVKSFW
ncbi:MAG: type II toxin-antitoxin system VapC family toxin [Proteobacteria bacterium]|nr:type II toxin-antitoxin system VapC family toxin [Desulfobacteraceae bacterium]MBU4052802.1 type II toxin-antitoxin system VapC family toxin [Pseudomonadota bacterium]MBU4316511.1 type II toxin-antitoxin system VapC family toxin [Pseudomonadota bacterium]MBU4471882.1 type II toxin-antitoxin system VapC family toxin [Pseudomonadota bacterium]